MPNVPNVPGVPPLTSYGVNTAFLAFSDALFVGQQVINVLQPQWAIMNATTGEPVFLPASPATQLLAPIASLTSLLGISGFPTTASFVEFEVRQDWAIATYPIEGGLFQTYDKVELPFDVRLRIASGGNAAQRLAFLGQVRAMAQDTVNLYDVVTPDQAYYGLSVNHFDFRRTSANGVTLIVVDVYFQQVRATSLTQAFANAATPVVAGQQGTGTVTATAPTIPPPLIP
jgi:hypothetical protein